MNNIDLIKDLTIIGRGNQLLPSGASFLSMSTIKT